MGRREGKQCSICHYLCVSAFAGRKGHHEHLARQRAPAERHPAQRGGAQVRAGSAAAGVLRAAVLRLVLHGEGGAEVARAEGFRMLGFGICRTSGRHRVNKDLNPLLS